MQPHLLSQDSQAPVGIQFLRVLHRKKLPFQSLVGHRCLLPKAPPSSEGSLWCPRYQVLMLREGQLECPGHLPAWVGVPTCVHIA